MCLNIHKETIKMSGIEWLRSIHTKQLLKLRKECYRKNIWGCRVDIRLGAVSINYQELKQVLSERPHIPNGAETKRIRKTAAKYKIRIHQFS